MLILMLNQKSPDSLNAWGDFFAGAFAPIGFLWIVLGYRQQGAELAMQAAELANSVEAQNALVEVSRQQLAQAVKEMQLAETRYSEAMERDRKARWPKFQVSHVGSGRSLDIWGSTFEVTNVGGGLATYISISTTASAGVNAKDIEYLRSGETAKGLIEFDLSGNKRHEIGVIEISATDGEGIRHFFEWSAKFSDGVMTYRQESRGVGV